MRYKLSSQSNGGFFCSICENTHDKQVFISHAAKDKQLARKIAEEGCKIGITSYLYELSPESLAKSPPAETIERQIIASGVVFVLLSESMSEAYWTQAWIGFEIGVARGVFRLPETLSIYRNRIVVLQDINQGIKVSIPQLDVVFLFDFNNQAGWDQYKDMTWVLTLKENSSMESGLAFFQKGNEFQESTMKANVKCDNVGCKSEYEAWIAIEDAGKLGKALNPVPTALPRYQAECTIECPSCDQVVTRIFTQML